MNAKYRFFLRLGASGQQQAVHPVWKDDLALEYARESGQMFMRASLSSSIDFVGDDYAVIVNAVFETEFFFDIEMSTDNGHVWSAYWTGRFFITDCTVYADDEKITVKPETYDRYNKILAGLEKEYDLIRLAPAIVPVTVQRRPMIQIYALGDQVLTNILSGMSWEQDCDAVDDYETIQDSHFGKIGGRQEITVDTSITGLTATFVGSWVHGWDDEGEWFDFSNGQGVYRIAYFQDIETQIIDDQVVNTYTNGLRIYRISDGVLCWEYERSVTRLASDPARFMEIPDDFTFSAVASGLSDVDASWNGIEICGRLVTASATYNGNECYEIPKNDIVATNRNYRYCIPFPQTDVLQQTNLYSADPTEWGIRPDETTYYVQPAVQVGVLSYIPVGRSLWNNSSTWFKHTNYTESIDAYGRKETQIRDTFPLDGVISALLGEIDPSLSFGSSTAYSAFLYGSNPLLGVPSIWGRLFLTPKSNVTVAEYTQPARKALITLKDVMDMLRKTCGLYWFIDGSGRLRIEHVSWFRNGGTYSGSRTVGIDLTSMYNTRNGKTWSFGTSQYKFDKVDMPERYQFGWMDDSTDIFAGFPIEVLSKYVTQGQIEEDTVAMFNSDIDFLMLDPSNVSVDGFALLNCVYDGGEWRTRIDSGLNINGGYYTVQNWVMSFAFLQPAFLISDMPSWSIKVNGLQTTAKGISRNKTQQVVIPVGNSDPDVAELVRTGIGDGEITKMSIRLTSRMAQTTLIYDTVQQQS